MPCNFDSFASLVLCNVLARTVEIRRRLVVIITQRLRIHKFNFNFPVPPSVRAVSAPRSCPHKHSYFIFEKFPLFSAGRLLTPLKVSESQATAL